MPIMKYIFPMILLILSLFAYAESSSSSINWLSKQHADSLYCRQFGTCTLTNLSVLGGYFNVSVVSYNVTGNFYLNGINIFDTFYTQAQSYNRSQVYNKSETYNKTIIDQNMSKYLKNGDHARLSSLNVSGYTRLNDTVIIPDGEYIVWNSIANARIGSTSASNLTIYADARLNLFGDNIWLYADYTHIPVNGYLQLESGSRLNFNPDPDTAASDAYIELNEGVASTLDIEAGSGQSIQFLSDLTITQDFELPDAKYLKMGNGGLAAGDFQMGYAGSGVLVLDRLTGTGVTATDFVINEASRDLNVRIETDNRDSVLFIDGGLNNVGIHTKTPSSSFQFDLNGTSRLRGNVNITGNLKISKNLNVSGCIYYNGGVLGTCIT